MYSDVHRLNLNLRLIARATPLASAITLALLSLHTSGFAAEAETTLDKVTIQGQQSSVIPTRPVSSVSGIETAIIDVTRSVYEISSEQLERDSIKTSDDLVKYAPGITRGGGQNVSVAPLIRGQGSELFQDGQRIYNVRHPFNLNAFEGIDVVAGPASEVFGPSSRSGGYANFLTKKPDFASQHSQISGQVGTLVPGDNDYHSNRLTIDTTGPVNDQLAYRLSATGQRFGDYYQGVRNNFNSYYGALAFKPTSKLRIDLNFSNDDYYDFNIVHGWNRVTQQLVDNGQYYAGRATPIISVVNSGVTRYYSPVFSSGAYNSAVIGWQQRTPNAQKQYVAGPLLTGAQLPSFLTNPATPGSISGWVYDPTLAGNGQTSLSPSAFSRAQDQNTAKRTTSQGRIAYDLSSNWSVVNSTLYQKSNDTGDSVGSFFSKFTDEIFDNRLELRGKNSFELFGLKIRNDSNTGTSYRRENFITEAANNSFTIAPYDLTAPLSLKTPATLVGLSTPNSSGSWIGTAGVPQLSSIYGYLNLPRMYPIDNGFYSEIGGSAPNASYTAQGSWSNTSLFTQQNFVINDKFGFNIGWNGTWIRAQIQNPLVLTPAQNYGDSQKFWLPSYQYNAYYKPTENSTLYATYDHSYALNTGGFADVLTWGANNKLNPLAFHSLSTLREVGFKADVIPNQLFASIAAYRQERDLGPDTSGNIARIKIKGIDAALRYQASRDLSFTANYSYLKARYTYLVFPATGFFSPSGFVADNATVFAGGNALNQVPAPTANGPVDAPGLPANSLNAAVDYQFGHGFGAELAAWWTSKWYTSLTKQVLVPNEHSVNLTLYYRQPQWDVALRLLNITDQRNYANGLTGATNEFVNPTQAFAIQGTFAYRF